MREDYLVANKSDLPLEGKDAQPLDVLVKEWGSLDRKCLAAVRPCLTVYTVWCCECKMASKDWETLRVFIWATFRCEQDASYREAISRENEGRLTIWKHVMCLILLRLNLECLKSFAGWTTYNDNNHHEHDISSKTRTNCMVPTTNVNFFSDL